MNEVIQYNHFAKQMDHFARVSLQNGLNRQKSPVVQTL